MRSKSRQFEHALVLAVPWPSPRPCARASSPSGQKSNRPTRVWRLQPDRKPRSSSRPRPHGKNRSARQPENWACRLYRALFASACQRRIAPASRVVAKVPVAPQPPPLELAHACRGHAARHRAIPVTDRSGTRPRAAGAYLAQSRCRPHYPPAWSSGCDKNAGRLMEYATVNPLPAAVSTAGGAARSHGGWKRQPAAAHHDQEFMEMPAASARGDANQGTARP